MNNFRMLLLREWLQYKWVWSGIVGVCLLLMAAAVSVSTVDEVDLSTPEPILMIGAGITLVLVMMVVLMAASWQLMLLPRRDQQDRSIEFWASLPGSDSASIAAPLLAHGLLMPLGALLVALVVGLPMGVWLAARELGWVSVQQIAWGPLMSAWTWLAIRLVVGGVLASLWLAPIVLFVMAATAWLRVWGAALVLVALTVFVNVYDLNAVKALIETQMDGVRTAFVAGVPAGSFPQEEGEFPLAQFFEALTQLPAWAREDIGNALRHLVHPQFLAGLAIAAACFWLLVLQRRRSL